MTAIATYTVHIFQVFMEHAATTDIRDMMDMVGEVRGFRLKYFGVNGVKINNTQQFGLS